MYDNRFLTTINGNSKQFLGSKLSFKTRHYFLTYRSYNLYEHHKTIFGIPVFTQKRPQSSAEYMDQIHAWHQSPVHYVIFARFTHFSGKTDNQIKRIKLLILHYISNVATTRIGSLLF